MTNEQREAIEICKEKIIESFYDFPNPTSIELKDTDVEAIEIVLSLIKEQEIYINKSNDIIEEMNRDIRKLISELKEKDKQIKDLQSRKDNQEKRFKKYKENIDKQYEEMYENLEKISQDLDNVAIDQIPIAIAELKYKNQVTEKQIDLMADKLVEAHEWFYSEFDNFTKEDFIEYFETKAKKGE